MGGSDFNAVPPYTYDDASYEDFGLNEFSIAKDLDFVVPSSARHSTHQPRGSFLPYALANFQATKSNIALTVSYLIYLFVRIFY
jgi:hypothetical protein